MIREDAAQLLEISTRTLDRYVQRKIIKAHRRGKRTMFLRADVDALANTYSAQPHIVGNNLELPAEQNPQLAALISLAQEMHGEIGKKNQEISELNFQLGKYQEIAKNSIPLLESRQQQADTAEQIYVLKSNLQKARFGRHVFVALFGLSIGAVGVLIQFLFLAQ